MLDNRDSEDDDDDIVNECDECGSIGSQACAPDCKRQCQKDDEE